MPKKKRVLYPVVFMIVITSFFTLILAAINELSIRSIERQENLKIQSKVLNSLGIKYGDSENEIISQYNNLIEEKKLNGMTYYIATDNGSLIGYIFKTEGPGLWGTIESLIAVTSDFKNILGIEFINHSETPGLGGRIEEKWFMEQFRNIEISVEKNSSLIFRPSAQGNVDAITGATITSKAVLKIFNENLDEILKMKEDII